MPPVRLGLRENGSQIALLLLIFDHSAHARRLWHDSAGLAPSTASVAATARLRRLKR
jgi:hypothetical protein